MAKTTTISPDQGRLLARSAYGHEAPLEYNNPTYGTITSRHKIDLSQRQEYLLKGLDTLAELREHEGFEWGVHDKDKAPEIQGERNLSDIIHYYDGIQAAKAPCGAESKKEAAFRKQFELATGYETSNPYSDSQLTPQQVLGNKALQKFMRTYVGKDKAYARTKFRKQLDPSGEVRKAIRIARKKQQKRRVVTKSDLSTNT